MKEFVWQDIKNEEFKTLLSAVNATHSFELFSADSSSLRKASLPFYGKLKLLEATELSSIPPMTIRFMITDEKKGTVVKLDGTHNSLKEANKIEKPALDDEKVIGYAQFALASVMGQEGPFRLVQSMQDVEFSRDPTEKEEKQLAAAIKPTRVTKKDGVYHLDSTVLYSDCVYRAIVTVKDDGEVSIEEEKAMLTDMPTRPIMLE